MNEEEYNLIANFCGELWKNLKKSKLFLSAAPSWGKTTLVKYLYEHHKPLNIVFISPLVAINEEVRKKMLNAKVPILQIEECKKKMCSGVLILTPEKLMKSFMHETVIKWSDIFVIDECHLWPLWENFRDQLSESWMWLSMIEKNCIFLSGTFDLSQWSKTNEGKAWLSNAEECWYLNLHNGKLLRNPRYKFLFKYSFRTVQSLLLKIIIKFTRFTVLVFFPLKSQLYNWERWCLRNRISVLSCIGGQTKKFVSLLQIGDNKPKVILATSALSHGVNLPTRDFIFIFGNEWEKEIWTQMVSRGGRNGEEFYLLSIKQNWMIRS